MQNGGFIFAVRYAEGVPKVWIGNACEREDAKRKAYHWFGGDKDSYVVEPLTTSIDNVRIELNCGL